MDRKKDIVLSPRTSVSSRRNSVVHILGIVLKLAKEDSASSSALLRAWETIVSCISCWALMSGPLTSLLDRLASNDTSIIPKISDLVLSPRRSERNLLRSLRLNHSRISTAYTAAIRCRFCLILAFASSLSVSRWISLSFCVRFATYNEATAEAHEPIAEIAAIAIVLLLLSI